VLGGPGAGKGTQCTNIVERCKGWEHISAGDCLREERQNPESKDGQLINEFIKDGKIVPVEITVKLLKKKMDAAKGKTKFLIDGYPRNLDNVTGWESVIGEAATVKGVFFFDCPEDAMETRLLKRGETSGRTDDNMESIKKRFQTYIAETMPIVELYEKKGLVFKIVADREPEEVWETVKALVAQVEAMRPLTKPKFGKVDKLDPEAKNVNLYVKVMKAPEPVEKRDGVVTVLVADDTSAVKLLMPKGAPEYVKVGASLRVQNARVLMIDGYMHVDVNKWAVCKETEAAHDFEATLTLDKSAVQYELV